MWPSRGNGLLETHIVHTSKADSRNETPCPNKIGATFTATFTNIDGFS